MSRRPRVVVVGAGMTGLAAAHELTRGGAEVEVVERAGRPGGAVLTTPFAGVDLDAGPDAFLARVPHAVQLCREVGLGDDLVAPATRNAYLWCGDRLRRFPGGLLLGIPTDLDALASSGIVSPAGVRRAAEDLVRPADGPGPGCDESVADLVRRRLGPEVLNQLVDPLLSGIFAGDTEQLSLLAGVPQIAAAARRDASLLTGARAALDAADLTARHPGAAPAPVFLTVRGGLGRLVDALVGELGGLDGLGGLEEPNGGSRPLDAGRLRLATTVEALALSGPGDPGSSSGPGGRADPDGGGDRRLRLRLRPRSGRPAEIEADAVILTIPAPAAGRLVEALSPQAAQRLAAIAYASVTLVSFAYREADVPTPLDGSGFLVPRSAGLLMTACSWASSKFEHLASEGTARLRLSAGRIDDRRADALTDAALLDALRADLATTMGIEAPPLEVRVSRWPASLPQYRVGHLDHLAAVEDDLQRHAPGVVVTGAAFRGVGLPACIDQGRSAAQRILSAFG